jgi:hypothetical protein
MVIPPKTPIGRIETVFLEDLKPNPRNARTHSKRQIKLIADHHQVVHLAGPASSLRTSSSVKGRSRSSCGVAGSGISILSHTSVSTGSR